MDFAGNYRINPSMAVGFNIANVRDVSHRQTFGGDLLTRRALAYLTFAW
jgi:hypothetical protein